MKFKEGDQIIYNGEDDISERYRRGIIVKLDSAYDIDVYHVLYPGEKTPYQEEAYEIDRDYRSDMKKHRNKILNDILK
jgi:hypothetical protein